MTLSKTMFYTHQGVGNDKGLYEIFLEECMKYEGKELLIVDRINRISKEITVLVPGFLEQTIDSDNGEKISEVTPIKTDNRIDVARFLRKNGFAQKGHVSFFNNDF